MVEQLHNFFFLCFTVVWLVAVVCCQCLWQPSKENKSAPPPPPMVSTFANSPFAQLRPLLTSQPLFKNKIKKSLCSKITLPEIANMY